MLGGIKAKRMREWQIQGEIDPLKIQKDDIIQENAAFYAENWQAKDLLHLNFFDSW